MTRLALLLIAAALLAAPRAGSAGGAPGRRQARKHYTQDYLALKRRIMADFAARRPAPYTPVDDPLPRRYDGQKVMAFTFDACKGRKNSYNAPLIEYLRAEKIPATLFITGAWIDKYPAEFKELAADPLFEIENHGLLHRPCSYAGDRKYGLEAVSDIGDMVDEIELGARRIEALTGRRPVFYRPAAAFTDSICVGVAQALGMEVVTYSLLSGDAEPRVPARTIRNNILRRARPGAVVIMHFNRPEWHELEALKEAVPALRAKGYSFVKMEDLSLVGE